LHVEMLHFDEGNSHFDNIPAEFREGLYRIFEEYTKGYVYLKGDRWVRITREDALNGVPEDTEKEAAE
jgi:hypothetical protein